jgi:hypothetical protein
MFLSGKKIRRRRKRGCLRRIRKHPLKGIEDSPQQAAGNALACMFIQKGEIQTRRSVGGRLFLGGHLILCIDIMHPFFKFFELPALFLG